jgi:predicted PurR-regulated permease PerM
MSEADANPVRMTLLAVGLATLAISAIFVGMIWNFLTALFLAAIFSAMASPLYRKVLGKVGSRPGLATAITLIILMVVVLVPALLLIYLAAAQANDLARDVVDYIKSIDGAGAGFSLPEWIPLRDKIAAAGPEIASKIGELTGKVAGFFVSAASAATKGTARFFLDLFIMVYAMVFFMQEKTSVLAQLMRYSFLPPEAQERLVERTVSISRATIKGTLVIGIIQGALGGIGFAVAGIGGAAFWGAVMAVLSTIPGIGPAIVWVPGVIYLFATGETAWATGLALWCGLVVSTIDNVLRPMLVGRDTAMPDLMILVSTLGGLALFGAVGLIIGPVAAGLFITIWEIFRDTFGGTVGAPERNGQDSASAQ